MTFDDQAVQSQQTQSDGSVTFTSHDGKRSFQVMFNIDVDSESPCGGRVFPWKDSPSLRHPKDLPMEDSATDAEALQYLFVAMDLVAPDGGESTDGREPVEFAEPIIIFFGAFVDAYARCRKIILRKSGNSMGYGLKMPSVQDMQKSFTIKSEPISNAQINEGIFEKEKIIENSQRQILEDRKKSISVDAKFKSKKKYGTAFQLDEQMGMELVRNVVEVYADQVFKGDACEEFMGAIVDHLLTVHDKDAALREGKLIALRVKKLTETITNLQAEQLNTQQELRRERAKAQEDIDKMEAKYKTEVEDNMKKQTDADTERSEQ
ncbi:hypothetical protein BTUL_0005g00960 [Botrytis tulipae]|uniref:Uncharacterized protein n=1 Tax=Botrytis tulipae TaxID=87230 RepID=A0A4Z1FCK4_9HELO|nr:hypothetical protein BTUL_0005g00960 [Botrytis tulipae]